MSGQSASPVLPDNPRARPGDKTKVMIVDDSIVVRTVLERTVSEIGEIEVVASVSNAERALERLDDVSVDVILLDLEMPGMGGIAAIPLLREKSRGAQIIVVSQYTPHGAEKAVEALSLGAADTFPKPEAGGFDDAYRARLGARVLGLGQRRRPVAVVSAPELPVSPRRVPLTGVPRAVAIGASTGGIAALEALLQALPPRIGVPILVAQHLPSSFMKVFAKQLAKASGRPAVIAEEGMVLSPDCVYIAPGEAHLVVRLQSDRLVAQLDNRPVPSGCTPSLDPMFTSLARVLKGRVVGVVLSGMGRDGATGASEMVAAGGCVYVQDAASSAVWGMPRAVAEAGLASAVLPPAAISERLAKQLGVRA